ncbi:MAG: crossover junction endodeoxyribonuclease RuvC [Phycisphaeraceae bacterium]|nr:crossover junction endodeoxyribonuclease RuvC [Phycisphaeraceae bacterium]
MRIIGIDPGLRICGYGCVQIERGALEPTLVEAGIIKLNTKADIPDRLMQLHEELTDLITEIKPDQMAVEKLYAHYKHPRTAILMGHARGVILLCAKQVKIPVIDLPSTEVKKSFTGYGHASKSQIQLAVQTQYSLPEPPSPPDVADAIAIATTHARRIAVEQLG